MYKIFSILIFILSTQVANAQDKFWITFTDKDVAGYNYEHHLSSRTINNRQRFNLPLYQYTDVPVKSAYLDSLSSLGIKIIAKSKWLNSVSCTLTKEQYESLVQKPYVAEINSISNNIIITSSSAVVNPEYMHAAMNQMGLRHFLKESLTGEGVSIGVIDAGYYQAHTEKYLTHVFREQRIMGQKDFVNPERTDLCTTKVTSSDYHGNWVLKMIAGYDEGTRVQYGMAPNAKLYLARTENGDREYRGEEDLWISAMEWMDSLGVRLINTSLGYAIKMDDPNDNYRQEEMDGKTARITKAAQIASDEKGIFLVVSAGNEGSNPSWRIVSAPADAEGVLSVGATKEKTAERIDYSSIGPEFLPYLKPDVSCYSPNGTSFSAPAVTGFVACLMQKDSTLSNKELKEIIQKSGHLYPYGNNYLGYGIPQADRALKLIQDRNSGVRNTKEMVVKGADVRLKFDQQYPKDAVVFHKKSETIVVKQEVVGFKKMKGFPGNIFGKAPYYSIIVKRTPGTKRSTISVGDQVIEVIWEE
ncbi:MAG TPA: S8 family serine peptidase [Cytophagaceae bacterium]